MRFFPEPWYVSLLNQYGVVVLAGVIIGILILLFGGSNRQRDPRAGSKE
jgi:Zn-dependent protease